MKRNLIVLPDGTKLYSGTGTQNAIQSVTVTESVNSGTELTLGSVCCSCLEATIINPGGGLMLNAGDVVQLYKFETDEDLQSLDRCEKVGTFLLEKPVRPTANTLKITAYDFISLLDKDLSDWLLSLDGWPYAVTDFAKMVCGVCGLQANEDTIEALPNGSHPIQMFAVSVTGRKLMEWVGQIGGRFCRADKDGYIEFAWYEPTDISIGSGDSYYMGGSLSYEDYTVSPIEKVQIRLTEDDVGVVAPDGDTAEKNTYIITGNYLLSDSSTAAIQPIAQSLYDQLRAVTYTPLKVTVPLNAGIRAGQIIQVIDRNGKELPTYVMTAVQTGQRIELESTGSHRRDSTTVVNNESLRDLRGRVLTIQKSAEMLRVENKDLERTLRSEIEQTADSINLEVTDGTPGNTATIKLTVGDKEYSGKIDMTGLVTFTNLKTKGQTVINGSNITTGEILADLIKTGQIRSAVLDEEGEGVGINLDTGLIRIITRDTEGEYWGDFEAAGATHFGPDDVYLRQAHAGEREISLICIDTNTWRTHGVIIRPDKNRAHLYLYKDDGAEAQLIVDDEQAQLALSGAEGNYLQMMAGPDRNYIAGLTAPVSDSDAVNKEYVDSRFIGRMRLLTSADDCDNIKDDGVYWYSTSSVPANAPFENAAIIEVYGADNNSSQKIQRGTRYGAGGYSATRALYGNNWCEWYHYALTTNGVIPVSMGGTGGKTVAEAQAALHVTQDFLFSQLNSEGNKSVRTITSYPTKAGVYRVGNASAVTDATLPGSWGNLIIFDTGYVVHIFINSSGMWFQRTENTFVPKTTWNKVTTS